MASDSPLLVLIGAPGAGKTRTGKRVARALGAPFIDTDRVIVDRHGPISRIFADHGEPRFRELERIVVAEALRTRAVVALGGGAVLDPETQADLAGLPVVQLTITAEAVAGRIADGKRPLVTGGVEAWEALVAGRRELYDRLATHSIDTSRRPLEQVASEITTWLKERTA